MLSPSNDLQAALNTAREMLASGRLAEAERAYREILSQRPTEAEALINLAAALGAMGKAAEAVGPLEQALKIVPGSAEARANLGAALLHVGRVDEAIAQLRKAISLNANLVDAHVNLGFALLQKGDFAQGWIEHEWRRSGQVFAPFEKAVEQPPWDGMSSLAGKKVLIYAEQGLGDTIQFLRYVPMLIERCRPQQVILGLPGEVRMLARLLEGGALIHDGFSDLPAFDFHFPLLSLPLAFGTTVETIPGKIPYLRANENLAKLWGTRIAKENCKGKKVGLVWSGSANFQFNASRSPGELSKLAELGKVEGVTFVSLQKGSAGEQAKRPPEGMKLVDWTTNLNDLADTAALIENLDLVIASDTSVAHLAGAMGKETWVMLSKVADWRWMLERVDSPWYATMRLFRQQEEGDWQAVVQRITQRLLQTC